VSARLKAALAHAARGFAVFPLHYPRRADCCSCHAGERCGGIGKHPLFSGWQKDATTDEKQIRAWWVRTPEANIGIATGRSSGLWALDVDPRHGGDDSLFGLQKRHGALPDTVEAITGGGGRHVFFTYAEGVPNEVGKQAGRLPPGLDVRSDGGLVVAPGSIHASGRAYEWEGSCHPAETALAPAPEWLLSLVRTPPEAARKTADPVPERIAEGERSRHLVSLAGSMRRRGMEAAEIEPALMETNRRRCAPPLGEEEVQAIAESVCRYKPAETPWRVNGKADAGSCMVPDELPEDPAPAPEEAPPPDAPPGGRLEDFRAYLPEHKYIFLPSGDLWPAASVNGQVPAVWTGAVGEDGKKVFERPNRWLDREAAVQQMTWAPGLPGLIEGRLFLEGGWVERPDCVVFNQYHPPVLKPGDPGDLEPWWHHLCRIYPDDAEHILAWLAHRAQRPGEKVNHALVLGGAQGIGKDTLLDPVRAAVGAWNFADVSPVEILGRFNSFRKSVILRVSEARDLGDVDRYGFYEHLKAYTAAPPDTLRIDEKNRQEYAIPNVCGVILTTNHLQDGIYLPPEDRRHYVAWSERVKEDFPESYWRQLWGWYATGGRQNVAAYLRTVDISRFNPKAPPPQTDAWHTVVNAQRAPEDSELADALEMLGNPDVISKERLLAHELITLDFKEWLRNRGNARKLPHRLEAVGYVPVRNRDQADGRWKVDGRNVVLYGRASLTHRDRLAAVGRFRGES
jgi:hypothetical protein